MPIRCGMQRWRTVAPALDQSERRPVKQRGNARLEGGWIGKRPITGQLFGQARPELRHYHAENGMAVPVLMSIRGIVIVATIQLRRRIRFVVVVRGMDMKPIIRALDSEMRVHTLDRSPSHLERKKKHEENSNGTTHLRIIEHPAAAQRRRVKSMRTTAICFSRDSAFRLAHSATRSCALACRSMPLRRQPCKRSSMPSRLCITVKSSRTPRAARYPPPARPSNRVAAHPCMRSGAHRAMTISGRQSPL